MARWTRALVTGASSGIGDAIARELAAEGTDLVVVARNEKQLRSLAAEFDQLDVEVLAADLGDVEQLGAVEARLTDQARPIDLIVNNAGFGSHGDFIELDIDRESSMVDVNVTALLRLTHAGAGAMAQRGAGTILNVASIAGLAPGAGTATYSASKAFVVSLGDSLHEELKSKGVGVTTICPGFTRTEFQTRADYDASKIPGMLWQTSEEVAAIALTAADKGRARVVPGVANKVATSTTRMLPGAINRRVAALLAER